jgi:WD40 repeat protein
MRALRAARAAAVRRAGLILAASVATNGLAHALQKRDGREAVAHPIVLGGGWPVVALSWAPSGDLLAAGSSDNHARIWDAKTERLLKTLGKPAVAGDFSYPTDAVHSAAWSPKADLLAVGNHEPTVRFYRPESGEEAAAWSTRSLT